MLSLSHLLSAITPSQSLKVLIKDKALDNWDKAFDYALKHSHIYVDSIKTQNNELLVECFVRE